ncbi:MAG: nuclear transport factor 2 family protein [Steroidobacteraceae bacterium]
MRTPVMFRLVGVCGAVAMMSGCATSAVFEQELAKSNTQTVLAFEETVFNKHEVREAFGHYVGPTFTQHEPQLSDSRSSVMAAYINLTTHEFPRSRMIVQRTVAQGNLVATQALWQRDPGHGHDAGVAEVDIYRLENGRIVEHWNVVQGPSASGEE